MSYVDKSFLLIQIINFLFKYYVKVQQDFKSSELLVCNVSLNPFNVGFVFSFTMESNFDFTISKPGFRASYSDFETGGENVLYEPINPNNTKNGRYMNWFVTSGLLFFSSFLTYGQMESLTSSQKTNKTAGDVLLVTMPTLAMGSTFIWQDGQKGTYQFSKALAGTIALTYGLKLVINKERPNGENNYSFPSGHTSVAFASAAFVQKRYGWEYGIPAYVLAGYVGYTRIKATKHDGWDVLAGAAIGVGMSYLFTKPYEGKKKLSVSSGFIKNTPTIGLTYEF